MSRSFKHAVALTLVAALAMAPCVTALHDHSHGHGAAGLHGQFALGDADHGHQRCDHDHGHGDHDRDAPPGSGDGDHCTICQASLERAIAAEQPIVLGLSERAPECVPEHVAAAPASQVRVLFARGPPLDSSRSV